MTCGGPTVADMLRSWNHLGIVSQRWTGGPGRTNFVTLVTDDGHEFERCDTSALAAFEAATNAVVMLRMEQRRAARTVCPYGRPHDAGPCSACTDT